MTTPRDESALALLHCRLEEHFRQLSSTRSAIAPGTPVFALEHGLTEAEFALLRREVQRAVQRSVLPEELWLPFVVYAAEIGYEFSGDEYWQTFSARTPGWADLGDTAHQYIRNRYKEFRDHFTGAEPTGPWAKHFSIICWPITHAVLPTDLQRHLARLLFDVRRSLTAETLDDPDELGRRLAAQAWRASARFQTFAQNTRLLGQVAAALLLGEEDESPYLLGSTLTRIVADLSKERQAQRWLRDAKITARHVRSRGIRTSASGRRTVGRSRRQVAAEGTDPRLFLRGSPDGWSLYIELPDVSALSERFPIMSDELVRRRPRISGVSRRLASGHLLYPGQQVRARTWPDQGTPLIQLEGGSDVVNELLADQCIMSPGPRWVFRIRAPSFASEVRGKFVRPGHEYLLVSENPCGDDLPNWASPDRTATSGVHIYRLKIPGSLDETDLAAIARLGLGAVLDVEVRPVGYVPASWDGEGTAEWVEGEEPLIAIRSSLSVARCILTLDDEPALVPWPESSNEIILELRDLGSGMHMLHVALFAAETNMPVAEGSLTIFVQSPLVRPASGTLREGIMILASPASLTLEELWAGRGFLELVGPTDCRAHVTLELADRRGRSLAKRSTRLSLPVGRARWAELFAREFQRVGEVYGKYDQAEACVVTVTAPGLGLASIRCERGFAPLRWAFGRDDEGPYVALVDNTGGGSVTVTRYDFSTPLESRTVSMDPDVRLRWPDGGLVLATDGRLSTSVVLPPRVRTLEDLQQMQAPQPSRIIRSEADVLRVIEHANLWAMASLPADPFAATRRLEVLRSIVEALASTIGGERWGSAEDAFRLTAPDLRMLSEAIGRKADQRVLASALAAALPTLENLDVRARILRFAALLHEHDQLGDAREQGIVVSEFLLRLATEPWTLLGWRQGELDDLLTLTLGFPVLLRAARFVVLGTALTSDDPYTVYEGWLWE